MLGYLDLLSDLVAALSYPVQSWWFVVALVFIVGPALFAGVFVLRKEPLPRRAAVVVHLGLLVEAYTSFKEESYSEVLVALRAMQPMYESLPQLMLQAYVLLVNRAYLARRLFSFVMSTLSLAFATTAIVAEHPLSQLKWARGVDYPTARFSRASTLVFGTVPYVGSVIVRGGFRVHPQDFVWWFLLYEVMEIVSRVLSLAVVALVWEYYFFIVLAWLWGSRWCISRVSIGGGVGQETLRFRALVRVVGMPLMDSVIDRVRAYKFSCFLTLLETLCFLSVGNAISADDESAILSNGTRQAFTVIALLFLAGKIALATAIIVPFKEKIGHVVPAVKGELRVDGDDIEEPAVPRVAVDGRGGGGGGGEGGSCCGGGVLGLTGTNGGDQKDEDADIEVLTTAIVAVVVETECGREVAVPARAEEEVVEENNGEAGGVDPEESSDAATAASAALGVSVAAANNDKKNDEQRPIERSSAAGGSSRALPTVPEVSAEGTAEGTPQRGSAITVVDAGITLSVVSMEEDDDGGSVGGDGYREGRSPCQGGGISVDRLSRDDGEDDEGDVKTSEEGGEGRCEVEGSPGEGRITAPVSRV